MSDTENYTDADDELVIDACSLLGLGDPDPLPEIVGSTIVEETGSDSDAGNPKTMLASASEPVLGTQLGSNLLAQGSSANKAALKRKESFVGEMKGFSADMAGARHSRRSLGKKSLTLSGRKTSEKFATPEMVKHLERNFSNILMLVSRSMDTLASVLLKNKNKGDEAKAITMAQKLTKDLGDVSIVITKATNQCDDKSKVSTAALVPDSVEEALTTSKHILSALLPKFTKMMNAIRDQPAFEEKIEPGLLDNVDLLMSDAAEQMDKLGQWLKESGFGDAAGAIMLAMRWKRKAFGGAKGGKGFGSVRIPQGKTSFSPNSSVGGDGGLSGDRDGAENIVASALSDAKSWAMEEAESLPVIDQTSSDTNDVATKKAIAESDVPTIKEEVSPAASPAPDALPPIS